MLSWSLSSLWTQFNTYNELVAVNKALFATEVCPWLFYVSCEYTCIVNKVSCWSLGEQPLQVARCTKIINADTDDPKYIINVKQFAKFVVDLSDQVAPTDIEEGMRVGLVVNFVLQNVGYCETVLRELFDFHTRTSSNLFWLSSIKHSLNGEVIVDNAVYQLVLVDRLAWKFTFWQCIYTGSVVVRASDSWSEGREFASQSIHCRVA